MGESCDSVSVDMEKIHLGGKVSISSPLLLCFLVPRSFSLSIFLPVYSFVLGVQLSVDSTLLSIWVLFFLTKDLNFLL